jgi:hypothetical protein
MVGDGQPGKECVEKMERRYLYALFSGSHSHRGFSPVILQHTEFWNRLNGLLFAAIQLAATENR